MPFSWLEGGKNNQTKSVSLQKRMRTRRTLFQSVSFLDKAAFDIDLIWFFIDCFRESSNIIDHLELQMDAW